ncbi:fumarylacetoacetate hydrolase family protein [Pontibacter locisalis]|uniref:Fumarylacetoacetate hydrolase family protein n=1 Tax=Pontibacter locisalis TaxID=1719035 RepID=A0ABW5IQY1_9BACT
MKLIRYGTQYQEKPGIILGEDMYDVAGFGEDYNEHFFETGGLVRLQDFVASHQGKLEKIPAESRLGGPVARPSKIVCIGLNYADHAEEMKVELPGEPILFLKSTTALSGPNDDIIIPRGSVKTDWEVELAVVMGARATYVVEAEAMDYVAGYCLHNDVSEREYQFERGGNWTKGKGCDSFAPLGPVLATKDEISDVDNLRLWLKVNGEMMQNSTTANFIFKIPFIISYVSQFMTLLPGDVISTGSPAGVGYGLHPPTFLKPGDVVELGIDNLGVAKQHVRAYTP